VLLGYSDEPENCVVLTHATPPSRGTPYHVRISGRHHRRYFDEAWEATDGNVTFAGDWHTHPGGHPSPSETDEEAMAQIDEDPAFGEGPLITAIAGAGRWRPRVPGVDLRFYTLLRGVPVRLTPNYFDELLDPERRVPDWRWPRQRLRRSGSSRGRLQLHS
jgi:integrative and conjugative element protein (TIGR02256 family)